MSWKQWTRNFKEGAVTPSARLAVWVCPAVAPLGKQMSYYGFGNVKTSKLVVLSLQAEKT